MDLLQDTPKLPIDYDEVEGDRTGRFLKRLVLAIMDLWRELVQKLNPVIDNSHDHGDNADATLSGTAKVFEVKDASGTTYYFKGYPTKT